MILKDFSRLYVADLNIVRQYERAFVNHLQPYKHPLGGGQVPQVEKWEPRPRKKSAVSEKKLNIYPPEFPDPHPEGVAKDVYLGQLAVDVAAGVAESLESEGQPGGGHQETPEGETAEERILTI